MSTSAQETPTLPSTSAQDKPTMLSTSAQEQPTMLSTSAQEKPTMLFVHGAWHSPAHFAPAARAFAAAGYPMACPCQPSFGANPPTTSMYEDAAAIRAALDRLIVGEGRHVILVMHSYGGVVGTQAAHESLGKKARAKRGLPGGLLGMVYVCAFVLPEGTSLRSASGPVPVPYITVHEDGSCTMQDPANRFYHDLPARERALWVTQLKPHPLSVQLSEQTYLGYTRHAAAYILCEADRALPLAIQERMVERLGGDVHVERLDSGHSPFLSMPEKFLEAVQRAAAAFEANSIE